MEIWAIAICVVAAIILVIVLARLFKLKRLKVGSIEVEPTTPDNPAPSGGTTASHDGVAGSVTLERNRFDGAVGDISGVKQTRDPGPRDQPSPGVADD